MHRHAGGMCQVLGSKCVYRERKRGLKYNRISCFWVFHALPSRSDSGDTLSPCSMMRPISCAFGRPKCARGFCENRFQTPARKRFLPFKKDTNEQMPRSHVGRMGLYTLHRRLWDGRGNDGKSTFPPQRFYPKQPNEQLRVDTAARPAQGCIVLLRGN